MQNIKNPVKKMYSLFNASWYDPFQKIWGPKGEIERAFLEKLRMLSNKETRILDLGCGTGANFERLQKNKILFKEYTGVDMTQKMLAIARKKFPEVNFVEGDINKIKKNYDLTISSWVFEHLTDQQRKNILKKKGRHLHMYLGGRKKYNVFLRLFASLFHFSYVDDKELRGKKTQYGIATTIVEVS